MRHALLVLIVLFLAVPAIAQTPVPSPTPPTTKLQWDHDGVNTDGYALTIDGVRAVVTPTCAEAGTPPVRVCAIPFPALTPGTHTLVVSAFNISGESASAPFAVNVIVKPTTPTNLRIK